MQRRTFLAALGGIIATRLPWVSGQQATSSVVARAEIGMDVHAATRAAVAALGGMHQFVRRGNRVVVKPNASWARPFSYRANTHPDVVAAVVQMALDAGAAEVRILENPVDGQDGALAFELSRMNEVSRRLGVPAHPVTDPNGFVAIEVPKGVRLRHARVIREIVEADVVINVPVAKSHVVTRYSGALKNWMGIVQDRRFFHMNFSAPTTSAIHASHVDQCTIDIHTRIRPALNVLDASSVMVTNGPEGPGDLIESRVILASRDAVAIDACACGLMNLPVQRVRSLELAAKAGLGERDASRIQVVRALPA